MPSRTEAVKRKLGQSPPEDYRYCACSRLHLCAFLLPQIPLFRASLIPLAIVRSSGF